MINVTHRTTDNDWWLDAAEFLFITRSGGLTKTSEILYRTTFNVTNHQTWAVL